MINHTKSEIYQEMIDSQGMKNLVFHIKEIIDDPNELDIWIVF